MADEETNIRYDSDGKYVPHVKRDSRRRIVKAWGTIPYQEDGLRGSRITPAIRRHLEGVLLEGDDAGHIIPFCLGGSGRHEDNVFPQNARKTKVMVVQLNLTFTWEEKNGKVCEVRFRLGNPFPNVTSKMMKDAVYKAYMEIRRLLAATTGLLRDFVVDTVKCVFSGIVRTVQFMLDHPLMTIGIAASLYLTLGQTALTLPALKAAGGAAAGGGCSLM